MYYLHNYIIIICSGTCSKQVCNIKKHFDLLLVVKNIRYYLQYLMFLMRHYHKSSIYHTMLHLTVWYLSYLALI